MPFELCINKIIVCNGKEPQISGWHFNRSVDVNDLRKKGLGVKLHFRCRILCRQLRQHYFLIGPKVKISLLLNSKAVWLNNFDFKQWQFARFCSFSALWHGLKLSALLCTRTSLFESWCRRCELGLLWLCCCYLSLIG